MIKFGIISFAHMHANGYASALRQICARGGDVELAAIADSDIERGKQKAAEFGAPVFFADYRDMLKDDIVDTVIICSENARHAEEVEACLRAGKHVLCEKPIGVSPADLERMRAAATADGAPVFQTAFVCRFAQSVVEAKRRIDNGEVGAVRAISATNHGSYPGGWFGDKSRSGGGAIMDHTVHAADVVRMLTGDEFDDVRAFQGRNLRDNVSVEDNAVIYARLRKTGVPVSIDCSWSRHANWPTWGDLTLNIFCERGAIKVDAFRPHIQLADAQRFAFESLGEDLNVKLLESFVLSIKEWRGEVRANHDPHAQPNAANRQLRAGFNDGARAVEVALAAYESVSGQNKSVQMG